MRRSFLFMAAGLLASVALGSPSRAGSIIETESHFTLTGKGVLSASDLEFTYSPGVLPPVPALVTINSTDLVITSASSVGNLLTINFCPAASGNIDFTFGSLAAPDSVFLFGTHVNDVAGHVSGILQEGHIVSVTGTVPEPTSMALLGVGMACFFSYRRMFKRAATV